MPSNASQRHKMFKRRVRAFEKERTARELQEQQQVRTEEEMLETLRWRTNGEFPRDIRQIGSMQHPLATMIPQMQAFLDSDEDVEYPLPYPMPPLRDIKSLFVGAVVRNRILFDALCPMWDAYEKYILPHETQNGYGEPSFPKTILTAAVERSQSLYKHLFKTAARADHVCLTEIAMELFAIMKIRQALAKLRAEFRDVRGEAYDWVDMSDVASTEDIIKLLKFCQTTHAERRIFVFPMLALNHAFGLAAAASMGADNLNTFRKVGAAMMRVTWNGGSQCDRAFSGVYQPDCFWKHLGRDDVATAIARLVFEQRECPICMNTIRVGSACSNLQCLHLICHVCMMTGVRRLDATPATLSVSTLEMVNDIIPASMRGQVTFQGFGLEDTLLPCILCRVGFFRIKPQQCSTAASSN